MTQIRKRSAHKFQARVRLKGHPEFAKTFPTRKAARGWAEATEEELLCGRHEYAQRAHKTSLHDALGRYSREITPLKKAETKSLGW